MTWKQLKVKVLFENEPLEPFQELQSWQTETQDVSRKEQMSICLHVDNEFVPHEEFIGMYEPHNTTGKTIATCIKDVCLCLQLPLSL